MRTEHVEIRAIDSLLSHARAAVVVGKHGHTVVERNRLRRRLRELTRQKLIPELKADMVIRALPGAYTATFDQLRVQIERLCEELRAMAPELEA